MPMDWEKWQQKRDSGVQPPDMDKVVQNFKRMRGRMPSGYLLIILAIVIWLLSGIYIVNPRQVGVVKQFGKYKETTQAGPHYHWPYPIETVEKPNVTDVQRIEIGFRTIDPGPPPQYRSVTDESLMLTGDENIIDVQFSVQFKIKDAEHYLFNVEDPAKTIRDATEAAMREIIGNNKIDNALTEGKFDIQRETKDLLQDLMDRQYEAGLEIVAVQLQEVHPPQDVRAAFKDVASAREDQNRFINEAEGYANDILPKAKGEAEAHIRRAEAYKEEKVERAEGDASRFLSVLEEYKKAKDVTRKRLYLETMEQILARAKKFVMDPQSSGVLPLLPLQGMNESAVGATKGGK